MRFLCRYNPSGCDVRSLEKSASLCHAGRAIRTQTLRVGMPDIFLDHVAVRQGMKTGIVEPVTLVSAAPVLVVNIDPFELIPLLLSAREGHNP